jgi:hypothetical protein
MSAHGRKILPNDVSLKNNILIFKISPVSLSQFPVRSRQCGRFHVIIRLDAYFCNLNFKKIVCTRISRKKYKANLTRNNSSVLSTSSCCRWRRRRTTAFGTAWRTGVHFMIRNFGQKVLGQKILGQIFSDEFVFLQPTRALGKHGHAVVNCNLIRIACHWIKK